MQEIEKLDLKDRKILFELEQDSRQSLQQIAKKVGLSKEAVFHRIKNLQSSGIIKRFITHIDIYRLGYTSYPLLLKFHDTTPHKEAEIIDFLGKNKQVAWLTSCEGNWDINMTIVVASTYALDKFVSELTERFGEYISDKKVFISTEIHYFKQGFGLDRPTKEIISTGKSEIQIIDNPSMRLLKIISENARMPTVELAKLLQITPKMAAGRIKKLEKEKIIQGSSVMIDFSKIGYKFYKVWFSLRNMNKERWTNMLAYFHSVPNMIWATRLIGEYDLSIEMEVQDVNEFRKIISDTKEKFPDCINKHESILVFEEHLLTYMP